MADEKYIDLDAFLEEAEAVPPVVKVKGTEYTLPVSPPAGLMLRAQRVMVAIMDAKDRLKALGPDADVPDDLKELITFDMDEYAAALIGRENLDAMLEDGLTHQGLQILLRKVMAIHQGGGNGPNRAARRKGGQSKSRTS